MKKLMRVQTVLLALALVMIGVVTVCAAPRLVPLTQQEQGRFGATDAAVVGFGGLDEDTANAAQTNTITVSGPCAIAYIGSVVDTPFDTSLKTNAVSILASATLGSTALIASVQVAADQWRPYKAIVPTSVTVTTSGTATNDMTSVGSWAYSTVLTNGASTTLTLITGAPGSAHSLDSMTQGQIRHLFRIWR